MAQPAKTAEDIIVSFELQVNDITELSSDEELEILNRVYLQTCNDRDYEFLKKEASGSISTDANGAFITLPTDFSHIPVNNNYTDNSIGIDNNAAPKVIFIVNGNTLLPYQVINWSDRRQYIGRSGYAYVDLTYNLTTYPNGILRFTGGTAGIPPYTSYTYDYIKVPPLLAVGDYPLMPGKFHDMLVFKMATENDVLQLSPKATSMQQDNEARYQQWKMDLDFWNSQFYNS